jgi:hypothetical protein
MRTGIALLVAWCVAVGVPAVAPAADKSAADHNKEALERRAQPASRQKVMGAVKDALGRPLAEVELVLQNPQGRIISRVRSDKGGHFEFENVPAGTYAVAANKSGFTTGVSIVTVTSKGTKPIEIALAAEKALTLKVAAKRLDIARNALSPETGGSVYRFSQKAIQEMPQGANTQMNSVLLQAPGVAHPRRARRASVPDQRHRAAAGRQQRILADVQPALRPKHFPPRRGAAGAVRLSHRRGRSDPDQERRKL